MWKHKIKFWINIFARLTVKRVVSFFANVFYWIQSPHTIKDALTVKKTIKKNKALHFIDYLNNSKYKEDKIVDWTPWIITVINEGFSDDCDGLATMGKFYFDCMGIGGNLHYLYRPKGGHLVAINNEKSLMISNTNLVNLDPDTWYDDVMDYFEDRYMFMTIFKGMK